MARCDRQAAGEGQWEYIGLPATGAGVDQANYLGLRRLRGQE